MLYAGYTQDIEYKGYVIKECESCATVYGYDRESKCYCLIEYEGDTVQDCKKWIDNEIEYQDACIKIAKKCGMIE